MRYFFILLVFILSIGNNLISQDLILEFENPSKKQILREFLKTHCTGIYTIDITFINISNSWDPVQLTDLSGHFNTTDNFIKLNIKYQDNKQSKIARILHNNNNLKITFHCNQNGKEITFENTGQNNDFTFNSPGYFQNATEDNDADTKSTVQNLLNIHIEKASKLNNEKNLKSQEEFEGEYRKIKEEFDELKKGEYSYLFKNELNEEFDELEKLVNKLTTHKNAYYALQNTNNSNSSYDSTPPDISTDTSSDPLVSDTKTDSTPPPAKTPPASTSTPAKNTDKEKIAQLERDLDDWKNLYDKAVGEKEDMRFQRNELQSENRRLEDQISSLNSKVRTLELNITTLESEKNKLEAESNRLKSKLRIPGVGEVIAAALLKVLEFPEDFEQHLYEKELKVGTETFSFVKVPQGSFIYGITEAQYDDLLKNGGELQYDNEITRMEAQEQTINTNFLIGKYEVTNAQYKALMSSHKYKPGDGEKPVVNLKFGDMALFCKRLNEEFGFDRDYGIYFDLPTEKEWEYAARGTDGLPYPWGTEYKTGVNSNANVYGAASLSVGKYEDGKSWCGAFDMIGNVYEACKIDKFSYNFETTSEVIAARGGSFRSKPLSSRTTSRYTLFGEKPRDDVGIRLVLRVSTK